MPMYGSVTPPLSPNVQRNTKTLSYACGYIATSIGISLRHPDACICLPLGNGVIEAGFDTPIFGVNPYHRRIMPKQIPQRKSRRAVLLYEYKYSARRPR